MLRVLLVGIGSRFNHVNLAVRILSGYVTSHLSAAENRNCEIQCGEWTTAVPLQELIRGITGSQPDIVLFSVYIWNQSLVFQVIRELPKIMPGIITGAGGPEVSYRAKEILDSVPELDFIISGEGEIPLLHLCRMAAGLQCRDSGGVAGAAGLRSGNAACADFCCGTGAEVPAGVSVVAGEVTGAVNGTTENAASGIPVCADTSYSVSGKIRSGIPEPESGGVAGAVNGTTENAAAGGCGYAGSFRVRFLSALEQSPPGGVWYRNTSIRNPVCSGAAVRHLSDLSEIPFPYRSPAGTLVDWADPDNRIFYYESSRGCPFRCAYCLSSLDTTVRYVPLDRVLSDIQFFLDTGCRLVKFTDRTFNLDEARCKTIWQYITDHHNGKTVFHFEIAAQLLTASLLEVLETVPEQSVQFEIGIQSIHPETLKAVGRSGNIRQIAENIRKIPSKIHVHLDLIAGLPFENIHLFGASYDFTASLRPDMLQCGFLKILSGTAMEQWALTHAGYQWLSCPPYEVLQSPHIDFADMLRLKRLEVLTDIFYNSGQFLYTVGFLLDQGVSLFTFFQELADWFECRHLFDVPHKTNDWFGFLYEFLSERESSGMIPVRCMPDFSAGDGMKSGEKQEAAPLDMTCQLKELLRFDFIRREKISVFPGWFIRRYDKEKHREAVYFHTSVESTRETFAATEYDVFYVQPLSGEPVPNGCPVLFVYPPRRGHQELRLKTEARSTGEQRTHWFLLES